MSRYFLGVDGGQSSTVAIIGDETGRVVGYGQGGPCNHITGPEAKSRFVGAIGSAIRQAADQAGLEDLHFFSACLGFSGGAEDKSRWLDEIFKANRRLVTHDGLIALTGATGGRPGIIIIAGTGQFAFGRNASGRTARAGGWGYIYGDEGGGFDLTRQAVRAALREEEGWGPKTVLRGMLLEVSGAKDSNDLLHRLYTPEFPRPIVAGWSRLVDSAAAAGDECAREILKSAARHLADYALAAFHNLFPSGNGDVPIACVGGVFNSGFLLDQFRILVRPQPAIPPLYSPAAGALLEAYREAGLSPVLLNVPDQRK
jgi:N-acetylglucosamine kinase-like BadF-type ATPase